MRATWDAQPDSVGFSLMNVDVQLPDVRAGDLGRYSPTPVPEDRRAIVDAILSIPGVMSVGMTDYRVGIAKGRDFGWATIRPEVERLVREHFGPKESDS